MASKHTQKDQEMAARLKKENVRRISGRCPICNDIINLNSLYSHVAFHRP